jgi:hypothetical protein
MNGQAGSAYCRMVSTVDARLFQGDMPTLLEYIYMFFG